MRMFKPISIFANNESFNCLVFSGILSNLKLIHLKTLGKVNRPFIALNNEISS